MTERIAGLSLGIDVSSIEDAKRSLKSFKAAAEQAATASHEFVQQEYVDKKKRQDAAREIANQRREFESLRATIDPTVSALKRITAQGEMLERAFKGGFINENEFMRLNDVLADTQAKLIAQKNSLTEHGRALNASSKATEELERKGRAFLTGLEDQISALGKSNIELKQMEAAKLGVSKQAGALISRLQQTTQQIEAEKRAIRDEAQAKSSAEKAAQSFIKQLQFQAETAGKTRIEILELKAAQLGVSEQAAPMIASLKNQTRQLGLVGVSAGQYRNAMRMLPAQITDVVTSLASGMPVWMVAIQQGGQIKDSFGGIGNTMRVLKGLINPVTVAFAGLSAVLGTMAFATYDYYKQTQAVNKALAQTGGFAYQTSGDLIAAAERIADFTNTSVRSTQKLMTEIAGTGRFTQRQLEIATVAAQSWAKASGDSASDFKKNFEGLIDKPVQGLAELDKAFKFLEPGQLTMIENIRKTKGETEATTKAFELFASSMIERSEKMEGAVSPLERAWDDFFNWVSNGWSKISQGFSAGTSLIIDTVSLTVKQIQYLLNQGDIMVGQFLDSIYEYTKNVPGFDSIFGGLAESNKQMIENAKRENAELAPLLDKIADRVNEGEQGYIRRANAAKYASDEERKAAEKNAEAVQKEARKIAEANKSKGKGQSYRVNEGSRMQEGLDAEILALQAQLRVLKEHSSMNDRISQQRKTLWNDQAKIAILEEAQGKRKLTDKEREILSNKNLILQSSERKAALGDEIALQERINKLRDDAEKYGNTMKAKSDSLEDTKGMSTKQAARYQELLALQADYINKGGSLEDESYKKKEASLRSFYAVQDKLQEDWLSGAQKAFADFGDAALDIPANIEKVTASALDGLSTVMTDFLTTGKANFADFAASIIKMIVEMIVKMMIFNSISGMFGGSSAISFSGFAGGFTGFANGGFVEPSSLKGFANGGAVGYTGNAGKYDPVGVVHGGEFVFTKEATQRIGVKNLNKMMRGYANGGAVGNISGIGSGGGVSGGKTYDFSGMNISISDDESGSQSQDKKTIEAVFTNMLTKATQRGGVLYPYLNKGE